MVLGRGLGLSGQLRWGGSLDGVVVAHAFHGNGSYGPPSGVVLLTTLGRRLLGECWWIFCGWVHSSDGDEGTVGGR